MKRSAILIAAAMWLLPAVAASAAPGMVTTTASLRAGPGDGFPVVDRIPGGSHVNIHGCLRGDAWCDISWSDARGWVASDELQWLYRNHYVYLSDYYDEIDVPVVPFVLGTYWSTYYAGRPFLHRRAHFDRYWRSHARAATRTPDRISRAHVGHGHAGLTERRGRGTEARTTLEHRNRAGMGERGRGAQAWGAAETRHRPDLRERNRPDMRGAGAARFHGAEHGRAMGMNHNVSRGAPMARTAPRAHFSAGGRAPVAQPNISQRPSMGARAQMPAARVAPAMPHGGGAAARGGSAHIGGVAPGGGGPGRHR